jgi:hypothetical protein
MERATEEAAVPTGADLREHRVARVEDLDPSALLARRDAAKGPAPSGERRIVWNGSYHAELDPRNSREMQDTLADEYSLVRPHVVGKE